MEKDSELQRLVEAIGANASGVMVTDATGTVLYTNARQCQLSGYAKEDIVGQNFRMFQPAQGSESAYESMWSAILSGDFWRGELLGRKKNGDCYWQFVLVSPVRDTNKADQYLFLLREDRAPGMPKVVRSHRAQLDPLTGLIGRAEFLESLDAAIREKQLLKDAEKIRVFCIAAGSLEIFRQGMENAAVDLVLLEVARRLRQCFRQADKIARMRDGEFAIFLAEAAQSSDGYAMGRRILSELGKAIELEEHRLSLPVSIGCASYPLDGDDAETVYKNAQSAVKIAQKQGGGTIHFYETAAQTLSDQAALENRLHNAVKKEEFFLLYQPQVNLTTGEISGVEALIRWRPQGLKVIPPNVFIPLAEKTDLIVAIGEWVLQEAIQQIRQWQKENLPRLKIAVNLSAKHFHQEDLPGFIEGLASQYKIELKYLGLELTENAVLQNPSRVKRNIEQLKSLGVQISLDDFGTGQSSLVWLSQLSVHQIKIDKSFISDVTSNPVNASIVAATVAMAQHLDMDIVAEGVETEAQLHYVRRQGCDYMQGYYFSQPCPPEDIEAMLRGNHRLRLNEYNSNKDQFTLLLVDDEPMVISALARILGRENYNILTAASGEEALEILAVNPVQIIISDHMMPGMTGVEFLSKAKRLYPDTIRIILSGQANLSTIIEAINVGAIWKYFTKPLETDTIRRVVRKACQTIIVNREK